MVGGQWTYPWGPRQKLGHACRWDSSSDAERRLRQRGSVEWRAACLLIIVRNEIKNESLVKIVQNIYLRY